MRIDDQNLENLPQWMKERDDVPEGWLYIGDDRERYIIGQPGSYNLLVFGANPSTATPGDNNIDPTIRKVRKYVEKAGYMGWMMANLYPLRSTNPENLPKEADKTLLDENIRVLKAVASSYRIGGIWAAWGDIIDTRFYLGEALFDIQEALEGDYWWFYAGKMTKKRNPRHPLYLDTDAERNEFYVWDYASVWKNADYD